MLFVIFLNATDLQVMKEVSIHHLSPLELISKLLQVVALSHMVDAPQILAVMVVGDTGIHRVATNIDNYKFEPC